MRLYSHYYGDGDWRTYTKANKAEMREIITRPPKGVWFLCISESGQKHLLFRTPVNHSPDYFQVQFEESSVPIEREKFILDLDIVDFVYQNGGINKSDYALQERISSPWNDHDFCTAFQYLKTMAGSPYLKLLIFFAQKKDEETQDDEHDA